MNISHEDEQAEKKRLKRTKDYIDQEIKDSEERLERGFEDYDFDDYSDDYMKAALKERFTSRIKNLKKVRNTPYFARVDFIEKGETKRDAFYLGKVMLTDHDTLEQIIIDWRAPVADLYYEGRLGEANYDCPAGNIEGEIKLKRQYFFSKEGKLENVLDIDITTNDEMLQPFLAANSDTRLKNIISTIQAEQNQIIRAEMWKPLIVQGVAGSGKTTIALHRIAYLIYNYEKNFYPEEFLIIAPNKFFLNYISNVLPDLGVDRVQQSTYEDIAFEIIGTEFEIEDPNEKLAKLIDNQKSQKEEEQCTVMETASMVKSSIRFKNMIDEYLYEVEKRFVPDEDFKIDKYVFMTKEEVHHLYYREYANLPIARRIEEITKHLKNAVMMQSGAILKDIEEERNYRVAKVKLEEPIEEIRLSMIRNIYGDAEKLAKTIVKDAKKHALNYFGANKMMTPLKYYKEFLEVYLPSIAQNRLDSKQVQYIQHSFASAQRKGKIEMEDLAPLMYLKCMIHGIQTKFELKHIVVDEAQDFSEFQFYVFKKIVKSDSMTILGDLSQGIYYYRGTRNWEKTMKIVFGEETDIRYLTLKKTYRTTEEIMNVANKVIEHLKDTLHCDLGEPVMKNGAPVTIQQLDSREEMISKIQKRLQEFKEKGFTNIAIIGKTIPDCMKLKEEIGREEIHVISSKDSEYNGGINIVPSYLSKGLEFDAVIITDVDDEHYSSSEVDTKLLYVCMTRAMNTLDIYAVDKLSDILR